MENGRAFEQEVLRVAKLLWPADPGAGPVVIGGRERDGVFLSEDCVHVLECTVARTKEKAVNDGKELAELIKDLRRHHQDRAVKGWFVTREEPTPDQRAVIQNYRSNISAVSYNSFRSKLVDAKLYLDCRENYAFGSATDPSTGARDERANYIHMEPCDRSGNLWTLADLKNRLLEGSRITLLGDYGAGKSTTCRELFYRLRADYYKATTVNFPVLLNLRDHQGQRDPAEALERHVRNVGYPRPHHLVRAWRAGFVVLLLDGFDELGSPVWTGIPKKLRDLRHQSMILVRRLVQESPRDSGVLISGRQHYFDHSAERRKALGLAEDLEVTLSDFTEEQVKSFLSRRGWKGAIPSWLPSRPLLVGYLAAREILGNSVIDDYGTDPARGWDHLLERICEREARMDVGISGDTIREIVEGLASRARGYVQGLGPLQPPHISEVFRSCCGYDPDERALILLQRMPGLAIANPEDSSRSFIDSDFADAARAGDVVRYVQSPYDQDLVSFDSWQCTLGSLGRRVAATKCLDASNTPKQLSAAARWASLKAKSFCLTADLIQIILEISGDYTDDHLTVREVDFEDLCLDDSSGDLSRVTFSDCAFHEIDLDVDIDPKRAPRFEACIVGLIHGRVSKADLPKDIFDESCDIAEFSDDMTTTRSILDTGFLLSVRVGLTVLKKLYRQSGSGRKENALQRGLDHRAKFYVQDVLEILRREGLTVQSKAARGTVWLPVKDQAPRIRRLLAAPSESEDQIITKLATIESTR